MLVDGAAAASLLAAPARIAHELGLRLALGVVKPDRELAVQQAIDRLADAARGPEPGAERVDLAPLTRPRPRRGRPARTSAR
jgi:hypothetical protein